LFFGILLPWLLSSWDYRHSVRLGERIFVITPPVLNCRHLFFFLIIIFSFFPPSPQKSNISCQRQCGTNTWRGNKILSQTHNFLRVFTVELVLHNYAWQSLFDFFLQPFPKWFCLDLDTVGCAGGEGGWEYGWLSHFYKTWWQL
jgi:hypothetical protein